MSKAFTSEDAPPAPALERAAPSLEPGEARYVTPEGLARLRAELEALPADSPRARVLAATLPLLTVLPRPPRDGRVHFGSHVSVRVDGVPRELHLVGPDEAGGNDISASSPLARALLGHAAGDELSVELPRGTAEVELLSVD